MPALIANAGDTAGWRYVEFFTANTTNDHARRAYARACSRSFAWCENRGLSLTAIRPFDFNGLHTDTARRFKPSSSVNATQR